MFYNYQEDEQCLQLFFLVSSLYNFLYSLFFFIPYLCIMSVVWQKNKKNNKQQKLT